MDKETLVLCLWFRFDLSSLSQCVLPFAVGASLKSETAPRTVSDTVAEFPITLTACIGHKISRTR